MLFKKVFDDNVIVKEIYNSARLKRYTLFIIGCILQAVAFSFFIAPSNLVFGVSGIAVALKQLLNLEPSYVILIANLLLLVASLIFLGKSVTSKTILGSILFPVLVGVSDMFIKYVDLGNTEPVIIALAGAVIFGLGTGLVFKAGYTTGGSDVIKQIISQYGKKTVGQATIIVEGVIVTFGILVFGLQSFIYSVLSIAVISTITDKVILGISSYKTFQIITSKESEIKQYILKQLNHGVTIINSEGGFGGKHKKILLCTIPTKEYFMLKEGIIRIDDNAFFIVTDTYEVKGGE